MVVRNAGHMVPISQPLWARHIAREFTRERPKEEVEKEEEDRKKRRRWRWQKPTQIKERAFSALKDCQ